MRDPSKRAAAFFQHGLGWLLEKRRELRRDYGTAVGRDASRAESDLRQEVDAFLKLPSQGWWTRVRGGFQRSFCADAACVQHLALQRASQAGKWFTATPSEDGRLIEFDLFRIA